MLIVSKGLMLYSRRTNEPVSIGAMLIYKSDCREPVTVLGGTAPRHEGSDGRVYVLRSTGLKVEVLPDELNCEWR